MPDNTTAAFSFPAVARKKVTAAFDGGRIISAVFDAARHGGAPPWHHRKTGTCFPERHAPSRILNTFGDMIRAHIFAISCGYEDADDPDFRRFDPAFKLTCGRLPDTGRDVSYLCARRSMDGLLRGAAAFD